MEEAERRKIKKYDADKPQTSVFVPFAMGTQCETGEKAMKWLKEWAAEVLGTPDNKAGRRLVWEALQELGVAIMKAQAKQIFDHAATTTRRRFHLPRAGPAAAPLGGGGRRRNARGGR